MSSPKKKKGKKKHLSPNSALRDFDHDDPLPPQMYAPTYNVAPVSTLPEFQDHTQLTPGERSSLHMLLQRVHIFFCASSLGMDFFVRWDRQALPANSRPSR